MRLRATVLLLAAVAVMPTVASAKECVEPYGKLVEVSPSVYEVRLKPECEGRSEIAAAGKADTKSKKPVPAKAKSSSSTARAGGPSARGHRGKLIARREDASCETGIGTVIRTTSAEIVIGFRAECKHLAAARTTRSFAASFFSDVLFDGGFEEEITPRRKLRPRKETKCDEAGMCTAMSGTKPRNAGKQSGNEIVVADASL